MAALPWLPGLLCFWTRYSKCRCIAQFYFKLSSDGWILLVTVSDLLSFQSSGTVLPVGLPIVISTLSTLHWGVSSPPNTPCTAWLLPGSAVCTSLVGIDFPGYRNLKVLDEDWIKTITSYFHLMYPFSNCSVIHICACLLIFFLNIIKYMFSEMPWRGYEFMSVICDWMSVRKQNMEEIIL